MRVTPKKSAAYGYHFRDSSKEKKMRNGTYGTVAEARAGGITLEQALKLHAKKYKSLKVEGTGVLTLNKAFLEWLENGRKKGGKAKSPETLDYYQECYSRYLEAEAGEWVLEAVTSKQWQGILEKAKNRSPNQARGTYWMLSSIYKRNIDLDELLINPLAKGILRTAFSGDDTKKERETQVPAIDLGLLVQGINALTSRNKQPRRALLFTLMSSWRKSAVLAMKWKDFDFSKGIYTVGPQFKGWKGFVGEMAVNNYMTAVLQERIAEGGMAESEWVFPARHGKSGHMIDIRGSTTLACKLLGYKVGQHDLRRTFATVGEVVLDGNDLLLGRLMAHQMPVPKSDQRGSAVTRKYIIRNLQAERVSGTKVAEAILEIAGMFPLSDEVEAKFRERGVDIKQRLQLIEMEDDDDPITDGATNTVEKDITAQTKDAIKNALA